MKTKRLVISALTVATLICSGCTSPNDASLGSALLHGLAGAPTATFGQSLLLHTAAEGLSASGETTSQSMPNVPNLPSDLLGSYTGVEYVRGTLLPTGVFYTYEDRFQFVAEDGGIVTARWREVRNIDGTFKLFRDFIHFRCANGLTHTFCFQLNRATTRELLGYFQQQIQK